MAASELAQRIAGKRFIFVTGKGGTGKTTVAAALATALSQQGKHVLLVVNSTPEHTSELLGCSPLGSTLREIKPRLWAVNVDPDLAMEEYAGIVLHVPTLVSLIFGNRNVKAFLRAVPGLQEWAVLGKAWYHTTETRSNGAWRFDVVIMDAPSTGHGMDMLKVPSVILDVVPPGILRRDAERANALFADPARSGALVVALPEELPTMETEELCATLRELGFPLLGIAANRVVTPIFEDADAAALEALAKAHTGNVELQVGKRRCERETVQAACLKRFRALGATQSLPELPALLGPKEIDVIASALTTTPS